MSSAHQGSEDMHRLLLSFSFAISVVASGAAVAADITDCSYLVQPNQGSGEGEAECLCAEPLADFSYYSLSERVGDIRLVTNNPYSEGDPVVPLSIGDRVNLQSNSSALLTYGPTCERELYGKASVEVREVDACACAALVETKVAPALFPVYPFLAAAAIACAAGACDSDPVSPE